MVMDKQKMVTLVDQNHSYTYEHVTQLRAHNSQLLLELQPRCTSPHIIMIEHFEHYAKFINDAMHHQCKQIKSIVVLAAIQGISQLVKDQSLDIKAIKS